MREPRPRLSRRHSIGLLAALPLAGLGPAARAAEGNTILVGGPDGGNLDRWAAVIQGRLSQALTQPANLRRQTVGGADGVTAANQFDARTEPDGHTVLLVPGDAPLAWLVGDPRARFDVGRWISVLAGMSPALLMARPGTVTPGKPVRVATTGPGSPDLPALLGLELLGARTELLPPLTPDAAAMALGQDAIDAFVLRGHKVAEHAAMLAGTGARPLFSLGAVDDGGLVTRCPGFANVPVFPELVAARQLPAPPALLAAWHVAAMAARTDFALVVPQLTPANMIAMWRHAASEAVKALDLQAMAAELGVRPVTGAAAALSAGTSVANPAAANELRRWISVRYRWKPA